MQHDLLALSYRLSINPRHHPPTSSNDTKHQPTNMRLAITLLLSLSTLLTTALAQSQNSTSDYQIKCLRFPPRVAGNKTLSPDAITALSTAFSDNSFNPPLPSNGITLKPGYSSRVGWAGSGGFQVCVQNFWFFKTLTVSLESLSGAVAAMGSVCCDEETREGGGKVPGVGGRRGLCQDAKALVMASDGSEIKVVAQDYGDDCCGMWGC